MTHVTVHCWKVGFFLHLHHYNVEKLPDLCAIAELYPVGTTLRLMVWPRVGREWPPTEWDVIKK